MYNIYRKIYIFHNRKLYFQMCTTQNSKIYKYVYFFLCKNKDNFKKHLFKLTQISPLFKILPSNFLINFRRNIVKTLSDEAIKQNDKTNNKFDQTDDTAKQIYSNM